MRRIAIVIVMIVIVVGAWWAYNTYLAESDQSPASAQEANEAVEALESVIWASGKLMPVQWAGLSPVAGGRINAAHMTEGDWVEAGDLLLELDNEVLKSQVVVAEAAVRETEAARDKLLAGATESELDAARADVSAAEAAVALAQAQLAQAQEAVKSAEAQVSIAQAQYNDLASRPSRVERLAAQKEVDIAQAAVQQAQAAYDQVRGDPHIGARPESAALQQATLAVEAAQAANDVVTQGATRQQLAVAQAQINAAQIQVASAQVQIPAAEAGVQSAQAQVQKAQAALKRLQNGATAEDIAVAEARIESATASLATTQAQLTQTQVTAPFAGEVGTVFVRIGELASPGQTVLMLGDTGHMRVETTDLRETDVTRLDSGMSVEVSFDALPDALFEGVITRIAPMSTVEKGSTNYTVLIDVSDLDPRLRWGMTAFVNIDTDR